MSKLFESQAGLLTVSLEVSLARIIVYSIAMDGIPNAPSTTSTPLMTPLPSGMNTPRFSNGAMTGSVGDYLTARLGKPSSHGLPHRTYTGGSKALDSLVKLIASTESFFHPSNSGAWTADVCLLLMNYLCKTLYHTCGVRLAIEVRLIYSLLLCAVECVCQIRCVRIQQK